MHGYRLLECGQVLPTGNKPPVHKLLWNTYTSNAGHANASLLWSAPKTFAPKNCATYASSSCFILVYSSFVIASSPAKFSLLGNDSFSDCGLLPSLSLASLCLGSSKFGLGGAGGIYTESSRYVRSRPSMYTVLDNNLHWSTHDNSSIFLVLDEPVVKPHKLLMLSHHCKVGLLENFQRWLYRKKFIYTNSNHCTIILHTWRV